MSARRPLEERFWEKINQNGPKKPHMHTACWLWRASKDHYGYGFIGLGNGKVGKAHKVSWERHYGPVPPGQCVLHRCDLPECSNPEHLFLGTQKANAEDRERKGRGNHVGGDRHGTKGHPSSVCRGPDHGNAALSEAQVREIRATYTGRYGQQKELARKYGVGVLTIRRVVQQRTYTNVGGP